MSDIHLHLAAVLEELPIAIALVSPSGRLLGKAGGMADMLGDTVASQDPREAARWSFRDESGSAIPRTLWPSARALRGEYDDEGMLGCLWKGERQPVRVTCVPTLSSGSDVAAVAFLQFLDAPTRSAEGSHQELQQRLIRELAKAVSSSWRAPTLTAAGTPTPS